MTFDLWETVVGNDTFIGIFDSLTEAKTAGDARIKDLNGMPRAFVQIEWCMNGADHAIKRSSDDEKWLHDRRNP